MQSQEPFHLACQPGARADIRIIKVTGPLTLQHVFAFQDELRKDLKPFNVIDLSGVAYIDSAGMGAIINFYVSSEKAGKKLVVTGVSERVMALFTLTHVDRVITIKPSIADAEAGF
jgi:anti-sigma B factor antagonist